MSKRIFSYWGVEHIVIKGNNGRKIFTSSEECQYFLNLLHSKCESTTQILAYCLMNNHVHIVLKESCCEKISTLMQNTIGPYAIWFNERHHRQNVLFRPKFHNEPIEDEKYLINAIRYVHNNPVKARLVTDPSRYKWSSYNEYFGKNRIINLAGLEKYVNKEEIKFDENQIYYCDNKNEFYDGSYEYVNSYINEYLENMKKSVMELNKVERKKLIATLKQFPHISNDMLAKIFNVSIRTIVNIK